MVKKKAQNEEIKILVVDDDNNIRFSTTRLLEKEGYTVIEAASGNQAMKLTRQESPDLVLLDRILPDTDGIELCKKIKSVPGLSHIMVILTSGIKVGTEEAADGLYSGADGYITRPIGNRELIARVESYIRLSRKGLNLKKRAEALAAKRGPSPEKFDLGDTEKLIHDLEVYQIELEIQNEELRSSHRKLEQTRNMYFQLYNQSPVGYATLDKKAAIEIANFTLAEMLRVDYAELMTSSFSKYVSDEFKDIFLARYKAFFKNPKDKTIEIDMKRSDGTFFRAELQARQTRHTELFNDIEFSDSSLQVTITDISQRVSAEENLKKSEYKYKHLFNNTNDAILLLDMDQGKVLDFNETAAGFYGYSRLEMKRLSIFEIEKDLNKKQFKKYIKELENEGSISHTTRHQTRDGEVHHVNNLCTLLELENQKIIQCVVRDISDLIHEQQEKTELHEMLMQSQKLEAVGRLAGGIAHDFNNLLTVISGVTELMLLEAKRDPIKKWAIEIKKAAHSAAALTQQLLAFSRKQIIAPKIVDINEIIENSRKLFHRIIGEDIEFEFDLAEELGKIKIDVNQFEQILVNLIVNARDAIEKNGEITVITYNRQMKADTKCSNCGEKMEGEYVVFELKDNGHGMDEEVMNKIFEPFFTTKEMARGTGLGLPTVHGIVHQHGGHIQIESTEDAGTTVKIYFPEVDAADETISDLEDETRKTGSELILVVEDQEMVRKITSEILKSSGYRVLLAEDGERAIEQYTSCEERIDLLITDVVLPGMNGREVYEKLSSLKKDDLPVLYMSGYPQNHIAKHNVLSDDTHFIQKPFKAIDLLAKVRGVLDRQGK